MMQLFLNLFEGEQPSVTADVLAIIFRNGKHL